MIVSCGGEDDRPQIEIGVGYMDREYACLWAQVFAIDRKGFQSQEMNRYGVAAECIQHQYIEVLQLAAACFSLKRHARIARHNLQLAGGFCQKSKVRGIGRDSDYLGIDLIEAK